MSEETIPYFERMKLIKLGLLPKEAVAKAKKPIAKQSPKKKAELAEEKERLGGDDSDLIKFYRAKMKVMGNTCYWCGCKVETHIYKYAIFSICHILEKRDTMCPSVKTHPMNFIILCPDHHTEFDRMTWPEREQLPFWDIIRDRLIMVWPDLAIDERRHFPESVLTYMEKHEPFTERE